MIRPATPDDSERLAALFTQLGYPTPASTIRERLQRLSDATTVFVAVERDEPTGVVAVELYDDFVVGRRAVILGLVIDELARNRGIGATLLRAAEIWAAQRNAPLLVVRSNVIRDDAHRFYAREGYRRVKSQHIFEKRL